MFGAGALLLAALCVAQTGDDDPLRALRQGQLVVWVVRVGAARTPDPLPGIAQPQLPMGYHEQTTGELGQTSSTYGQTAGSYGKPSDTSAISVAAIPPGSDAATAPSDNTGYHEQTAGSFGQTSSDYGQVSSDHGQTAGSLGQTSSTFGTASSNHGQTAGSFGNSLGTIAHAGDPVKPRPSALQVQLQSHVQAAFPQLQVRYVDVKEGDLADSLKAVEGSTVYPDVLVGLSGLYRPDVYKRYVLATVVSDDMTSLPRVPTSAFPPPVMVLIKAPHRAAAKAFALWLEEDLRPQAGAIASNLTPDRAGAAGAAQSAMLRLLQGQQLGEDADPQMAKIAVESAPLLLTGAGAPSDAMPRVDVMSARTNGRLAAVALRVMVSSDREFGVIHPLIVLRKSPQGSWRVLQVSVNLPLAEQSAERDGLMSSSPTSQEKKTGVVGVTLAAPADGETKALLPELWWDNGGGAGLQVVEWASYGAGTRLMLVPDHDARLQTRVTATFASQPGVYRWRVWSVGAGGEMKISPWSTMKIER